MPHFLRVSIGAWSAGTRVAILGPDRQAEGMLAVRVLVGSKPVLSVKPEDIVERGAKS